MKERKRERESEREREREREKKKHSDMQTAKAWLYEYALFVLTWFTAYRYGEKYI